MPTRLRLWPALPTPRYCWTGSGQFQRLIGKLLWTALAWRPLFSTLRAAVLPNTVHDAAARLFAAREIRLLSQLSPLARVRLLRPFAHVCVATDASPWLGAGCFAPIFETDAISILENAKHLKKMPSASPTHVESFVRSRRWRRCISHPWRISAHINELEASALLLTVRWLTRKGCCGMRVVVLSDSDVCIRAFSKGRSSSPRMLFATRRMAALLLTHDRVLYFVHVPSGLNPADPVSRVPAPLSLRETRD